MHLKLHLAHTLLVHFLIIPLIHLIIQSDCFVLQLSECGRYNGNFSERHSNQYFTSNISKTITNVTRRDCSLYCALHLGCLFFNHNMITSKCELLNSHRGELTPAPGWQFVSTSYKNVHLRGPLCRFLGHTICPTKGTHCIDSCSAPGFECITDVNIANKSRAVASSELDSPSGGLRTAIHAVDGDIATYWCPDLALGAWLLIDLSERRYVAYFTWSHLHVKSKKQHWPKMKGLQIRVGDKDESDVNGNEICVNDVDMTKERRNVIYCTGGPMWGQYVVLQRGPTDRNERWFVGELHVFALD